jgi:hypothetical protein
MPRKFTGKKRGGQPKETEKWEVSVQTSTILAFQQVAGGRARSLAARFLDDVAPALLKLAAEEQEPLDNA